MTNQKPPVLDYRPVGPTPVWRRPIPLSCLAGVMMMLIPMLTGLGFGTGGYPFNLADVWLDNWLGMRGAIAVKAATNLPVPVLGVILSVHAIRKIRRDRSFTGAPVAWAAAIINALWFAGILLTLHSYYHIFYWWI